MHSLEWPPAFEEVLRRHLPLCNGVIRPDVALADLGLNSLGTVGLVMDLEDSLNISMPDDVLVAETFQSAKALRGVVTDLLKERSRS